jgi:hypothetical protein
MLYYPTARTENGVEAAEVHPHKTSDKPKMLRDLAFGGAWQIWGIFGV